MAPDQGQAGSPTDTGSFRMMMQFLFLALLFLVAFFYSSVGHGGASGYLAVMALFAIDTFYMKASALTLNVFVSGIAFYQFSRAGYLKWAIILPFIFTSVPMAFLGAGIRIDPYVYRILLGLFLFFAAFRIMFINPKPAATHPVKIFPALIIGAALGFLSGMIGIGGGIILSPLLILFRWANILEAAAASAFFILVNSISGLSGIYVTEYWISPRILLWVVIAVAGGVAGSYLGSRKLNQKILRYILSGILLFASVKLIFY